MLRTSYGRPTNITDDLRTAYGRLRTATDDYGRPPGTRTDDLPERGDTRTPRALPRIPEREHHGPLPRDTRTPREYWQSRLAQRLSVSGLRGFVGEGKGATDGRISTPAVRDIHQGWHG